VFKRLYFIPRNRCVEIVAHPEKPETFDFEEMSSPAVCCGLSKHFKAFQFRSGPQATSMSVAPTGVIAKGNESG
jgi:hypothetical protein